MIENDKAIEMQKNTLEDYITQENDPFTSVVTSFNKEIKMNIHDVKKEFDKSIEVSS